MPPPPTHVPKPSRQMRGMGSTGHMIEADVHKEPGTVLTPAVQILPQ
jgi:hypothetical protein